MTVLNTWVNSKMTWRTAMEFWLLKMARNIQVYFSETLLKVTVQLFTQIDQDILASLWKDFIMGEERLLNLPRMCQVRVLVTRVFGCRENGREKDSRLKKMGLGWEAILMTIKLKVKERCCPTILHNTILACLKKARDKAEEN